jgi:hypothetical protein
MGKKRFRVEQIIRMLSEVERVGRLAATVLSGYAVEKVLRYRLSSASGCGLMMGLV